VRPILDPVRAMVALGDLKGAADRRCVMDVLAAWRQYCEACDRTDLLTVTPRVGTVPGHVGEKLALLVDRALATARNLHAIDAERHWQHAAIAFRKLQLDSAEMAGLQVRAVIREWEVLQWEDVDDEGHERSKFDEEATVAMACLAGAYATVFDLDRGDGRRMTETRFAHVMALSAVDEAIRTALKEADVLVPKRVYADSGGACSDVQDHCELCGAFDHDHTRECPIAGIDAETLLALYRAELQKGGR